MSLLHHVAEASGMMPETDAEHSSLLHKVMLLSARVQAGGAVTMLLFVVVLGVLWIRRRRRAGSA